MPPLGSADLVLVREAASGALGPAGPERLLASVVRGAARLCRTRLASIALLTERSDHLELRSVFGTGGVIAEKQVAGKLLMQARYIRIPFGPYPARRPRPRSAASESTSRQDSHSIPARV